MKTLGLKKIELALYHPANVFVLTSYIEIHSNTFLSWKHYTINPDQTVPKAQQSDLGPL